MEKVFVKLGSWLTKNYFLESSKNSGNKRIEGNLINKLAPRGIETKLKRKLDEAG